MEQKFLGKELLYELCNGKLPAYGNMWPCCTRLVFSPKEKFTREDWYRQVKGFRQCIADYNTLFFVADTWKVPESAKYGLGFLKEFQKDILETAYIYFKQKYIKKIRVAIRKYGTPEEKKEFRNEILSILDIITKIQDPDILSKYADLINMLQKMK